MDKFHHDDAHDAGDADDMLLLMCVERYASWLLFRSTSINLRTDNSAFVKSEQPTRAAPYAHPQWNTQSPVLNQKRPML